MLSQYPQAKARFDEMFDGQGYARDHWQTLLHTLQQAPSGTMRHRMRQVQREVLENGVTYNVYADPQGSDRPWKLDVLPLILPAREWAHIESAVIQRAQLMNRILLDVYGEQNLLSSGDLPASLIHGHAGFLRPCHGVAAQDGVALHHYAVDMARSPDGTWWAVGDRTQAPSGSGYALENRLVISRAFPELFRDLKIQRLAGFFAQMRDALSHWGDQVMRRCPYPGERSERPFTVLLTPGPYNETYYEQSYLARYLGYPLVQGNDLVVREGFVWLKTLSGLQRVHVIVRRVDDDYCDPLELRSESALGVTGLTEAARRGTVLITNNLGSNLPESGALLGFLPRLCELLLGQPLKMPSVATWWCGEPAALDYVIQAMDRLVFKPSVPQLRITPVFGEDLQGEAREEFVSRLRARPGDFVAQELVRLSQAPIWQSHERDASGSYPETGSLKASAMGLRVFACATPQGYVVMPGGLTRVAAGPDARVVSMQRGGASKDTWVIAQGDVPELTLLRTAASSADLVRGETRLASRTVENLFWFGRYAERCDNTARLLRVTFQGMLEAPPHERGADWATRMALCEMHGLLEPGEQPLSESTMEAGLLRAMHDTSVPGLAFNVDQLFRVAFNLRERVSSDNWRSLNRMHEDITSEAILLASQAPHTDAIGDAIGILDSAAVSLMTLSGFALDGMTRDMGWRFMSVGRRIERLQFVGSAIQHALSMPAQSPLEWLLELGDSIITYRSRYMARPQWMPVLDLMLLDEGNPRSVVFQMDGLLKNLQRISAAHGSCGHEPMERLLATLRGLDPGRDLGPGSESLLALMRNVHSLTYRLSENLNARFFSYSSSGADHEGQAHS